MTLKETQRSAILFGVLTIVLVVVAVKLPSIPARRLRPGSPPGPDLISRSHVVVADFGSKRSYGSPWYEWLTETEVLVSRETGPKFTLHNVQTSVEAPFPSLIRLFARLTPGM